jgi:hypothetical protein
MLEGSGRLTVEPPERHEERFGWRGLAFVIIGLFFLVLAAILMMNIFGHTGGASPGVVRPVVFHGGMRE